MKKIDDEDINYMENYARKKLKERIQRAESGQQNLFKFFGGYSADPTKFVFNANELALIWKVVNYVNKFDDASLSYFLYEKPEVRRQDETNYTLPQSHTHNVLNTLLTISNKNIKTTKPGYRFQENVKKFACYLRMAAGPLAYETLHKNLELCIPSLSATNRYIGKMSTQICEGELRSKELLKYLNDCGLPLVVSLSEDATRIDGRVQYSSSCNEIVGLVLPTNLITGLPIAHAYKARSASEIVSHFEENHPVASFVNVMMAHPLANSPSFCLLVYGTDMKYTAEDVIKRWNFIVSDLLQYGIHVISVSTDSDPKYNSAMRKKCKLGEFPNIFDYITQFADDYENIQSNIPLYVQDTVHIATKLRNWFLKTLINPRKYRVGKFYIQVDHLKHLVKNIPKDQHQLFATMLNPKDKQNFGSVQKICDKRVTALLQTQVNGSEATVQFLNIVRDIIDSYINRDLTPAERIRKIWTAVFFIRIWRKCITSTRGLTLEKKFLTQNCYACIEINAHSLILLMI